jgi:polyphosphate kinase
MARASVDNPAYYINRELSWLQFNRRVLEEAQDENNPLLERLKFLSISASNLDEFFEVRISGLVQQLEDGYTEAGPDGLTLLEERELVSEEVHKFVAEQYECWNERLRPQLADN